ncbi:CHASE2 domain-containing protein [Rhodovibrio sodomensis]|uniref:CHASE2 domain-containing protein n=1 Tax=Rhodovibrio sodomensis TaxID=1088 RepID=UPI00346114C9
MRIGGATLRTDVNGQVWLHSGRSRPGRTVAAADVLAGGVPPARIRGRILVVGTSAPGLKDGVTVPLARALPGFQLHGQAIEQAVNGSYLGRGPGLVP